MFSSGEIKPVCYENLEEVRNYITKFLNNLDLDIKNPPYTSTIYHPMRKNIFQNFQPLVKAQNDSERRRRMYELTQIVDEEMLNWFHILLTKPYAELILTKHYGIPKDIDVDQAQRDKATIEALQFLVNTIAEWNIQIERTVDSIQKIRLYQLWKPNSQQSDHYLTTELKSLLSPDHEFNYQEYSKQIMIHVLAEGFNKFGNFLKDHALSDSGITKGAIILLFQTFVGGIGPWAAIKQSVNLKLLFGGLIGSIALGKVSSYINTSNDVGQLYECAKVFRDISLSLVEFNENITQCVNECLLCVDEQDEKDMKMKLKQLVEEFLDEPEIIKYGGQTIKSGDVEVIQEDDWMIIQQKNKKQGSSDVQIQNENENDVQDEDQQQEIDNDEEQEQDEWQDIQNLDSIHLQETFHGQQEKPQINQQKTQNQENEFENLQFL